jgi:hypothetical protein
MLELIIDAEDQQELGTGVVLDELAREGARRMIAAALEAEVEEYVEALKGLRDSALSARHIDKRPLGSVGCTAGAWGVRVFGVNGQPLTEDVAR